MNSFRKLLARLRKTMKYAVSDPQNFEERWSFQSNAIRLISLLVLLFLLVGGIMGYLLSGVFTGYKGQVSVDRTLLEEQRVQLDSLKKKIDGQERYLAGLRAILSGEVPFPEKIDSVRLIVPVNLDSINPSRTRAERRLDQQVKDGMRTSQADQSRLAYFVSPVLGTISQGFDAKRHPGVDVVTSPDEVVKACLAGTVIYAGYTKKDGYLLLIEHPGNFISVYKHNKAVLKKAGGKVQLGDPIAIVGNSGENTDGPHLHFELWYNSVPVNPSDYLSFKR